MEQTGLQTSVSKKNLWIGRIVSGLPALFLLVDGAMKLVKPAVVVDATTKLGYSESLIVPIGIVLIVCTILYLIPTTSVLGAILLTGYLGGAVSTHVRANEGLFPIVFPIIFGVLLWLGLYLHDMRLWALIPLRSTNRSSFQKDKEHEHLTLDYSNTVGVTIPVCGRHQVLLHDRGYEKDGTAKSDSLSGVVYPFYRRV